MGKTPAKPETKKSKTKKVVRGISLQEIAAVTGLSIRAVSRSVGRLSRRCLVRQTRSA